MGIGVLEILIIVLIVLVLFGGYKRLPGLGRSAGTGVRKGGEKAKQIAGQVQDKAGSVDTKKIGESVGKGLREARDVRDTVKGIATDEPAAKPSEPATKPAEPAMKPVEPTPKPAEPATKSAEPATKPAESTTPSAEPPAERPPES